MPEARRDVVCSTLCGWASRRIREGHECPRCNDGTVVFRLSRAPTSKRGGRVRLVLHVEPDTIAALSAEAETVGARSGATVGAVVLEAVVAGGELGRLSDALKRP